MATNKQKIKCPECGASISIDDVLTHQIEEKIKKDFEETQKSKEARAEAEKEQNAKTAFLEEQLKSKDEKLSQATKNEVELRKEKMKLEDDKQVFELEKMRQMEESKKTIAEEATKKATEEQQYVIAQLKKQLTDATKAKDDLARKLEQGSQQTQGEVLELISGRLKRI